MLVPLLLVTISMGQAGRPARTPSPTPAAKSDTLPKSQDEQVYDQLAKLWSTYYAGKHDQAVKLADPLVKLPDQKYRWIAIEAAHVQARACWAQGTKDSQAKAQQLWKQIEKASTLNSLVTRLKIAKALEAESAAEAAKPAADKTLDPAKLKPAIDALEAILKENQSNTATPEAAIELARLYVKAKRFDDAKKTLDFVVKSMTDKTTITKMEIPDVLAKPYVDAAKAALAHLKYDKNAGMAEFEAAEKLRKAEKFAEALKAHQAVAKDFADSDYGPRGEMTIGSCLVGLKQPAAALDHWKKFIQAAPAGPWRAQALLAMTDTYLEEQLNLPDAGKYADIAKSSLPAGLVDERAGDSWKAAAYDVNLRVGVVAFCQGKGDAAAEAFEAAKKLTTKKTEQDSLDSLIAAAKSGKSVIPDDAKGKDAADRPTLALSMGIIYMCADRLDRADAFFDRVAGSPAIPAKGGLPGQPARPAMSGATPAQVAFAVFGDGALSQSRNKPDEAKERFLASIKAFADGTWHDESLYRIAAIIQDQAEVKFGNSSAAGTPPVGSAKSASPISKDTAKPAKPPTPQEREATEKAEKERLAALLKVKGETLPYWQEIIKRYPKSPRCEQAWYGMGVLQYEMAEAAPADRAEQMFKDAAFTFNRFCETYPKSLSAGDAYVRQTDIALERMFNLDLARQLSTAAVDWAKAQPDIPVAVVPPSSEAWRSQAKRTGPVEVRPAAYEIYLRAGLVAYLDQQYEAAQRFFESAKPLTPPRDFVVVEGRIPTGIECIITASREKRALTPQEVLEGDAKVRLVLQLGDVYLVAGAYQKALDLATLAAEDFKKSAAVPQLSWAHRLRAMALSSLRLKLDAKPEFLAAQQSSPSAPWAAECLFLAGTITHNHEKRPQDAIGMFEEVVKRYPASEFASKAAYFVGVIYEWNSQWSLAKTAYQRVIRDYPESRWASAAMDFHLKRVDAAMAAVETGKTREK